MSEFITVQVGQCGNQIGSVFWPQVLEEFGVTSSTTSLIPSRIDKSFKSFFNCPEGVPKNCRGAVDLKKSKVTARALLIDMEEKVVDRFQRGSMRHLFDKKCFLTNHPGSGNNWAVGHYTHFYSHRAVLEDKLRHMAEQCDCLCGVLVLLSLGGGTGAGLGTAVVRLLEDQFPLIDSGSLNCDLSDLGCLVPQPGLHYLSTSLSPLDLTPPRDVSYVNKKRDLLQEVCVRDDQLLRVNALGGQLLSAALLCRGQIPLSTLRQYVTRFQSKVKFAPWSDPGVKTGLCSVPPIGHKSAMLCLVNSANMANFFNDSLKHFNLLYKRKAHVHHYTKVDGFDIDDFLLTRESLMTSALKYSEATNFVEVPRLKIR